MSTLPRLAWPLTVFVLVLVPIQRATLVPAVARDEPVGLELKAGSIKVKDLTGDESAFNFLRLLEASDTFRLPGGKVSVTVEKGRARFSWNGRKRGPRVGLGPGGKVVKLKPGRSEFSVVLFTHPRFGTPFIANASVLTATWPGTTAIFVDTDLDGTHATPGRDLVVLVQKEKVWALPIMDRMPIGPHFGKPVIEGDPPMLTIVAASWMPDAEYREALALLNIHRRLTGTPPCRLDEAFCTGCRKHCHYLARNGIKSGQGKTHSEDPKLPGYSVDGLAAARNSAIGSSDLPMPVQIGGFLSTFFHRIGLIDPNTHRVGMAHAHGNNMLDTASGRRHSDHAWPVIYPAPGQYDVALAMRPEWPNPIPAGVQSAGFPITLTFGSGTRGFKELRAELLEGVKESPVPVSLSSPDKPARAERDHNYFSILVLPLRTLAPFTEYRVKVSYRQGGAEKAHDFQFRTGDRRMVGAWRKR